MLIGVLVAWVEIRAIRPNRMWMTEVLAKSCLSHARPLANFWLFAYFIASYFLLPSPFCRKYLKSLCRMLGSSNIHSIFLPHFADGFHIINVYATILMYQGIARVLLKVFEFQATLMPSSPPAMAIFWAWGAALAPVCPLRLAETTSSTRSNRDAD